MTNFARKKGETIFFVIYSKGAVIIINVKDNILSRKLALI